MAHFRKYYANNTAFSFSIPPRTAIMGIVAAAMGWPKDSYYEDLASENIQLGIRVLKPLKKSFHRLNFLSIKSTGDIAKHWSSDFRVEERPRDAGARQAGRGGRGGPGPRPLPRGLHGDEERGHGQAVRL